MVIDEAFTEEHTDYIGFREKPMRLSQIENTLSIT